MREPSRHLISAATAAAIVGGALSGCTIQQDTRKLAPPESGRALHTQLSEPVSRLATTGAFVLPPVAAGSEHLPKRPVGPVVFRQYAVVDALGDLLAEDGYSVIAGGDTDLGVITVTPDPEMSVERLVDEITRARNLFYEVEGQSLWLRKQRTFTLQMPPIEGAFDDIAQTVSSMGAANVTLDRQARLITFASDRDTYEKVAAYFSELARSSALLIYDTWIYEVALNDDLQTGIDWRQISYANPDGNTLIDFIGGSGITDGFSLGIIHQGSRVAIDVILSFLETQGKVETLARPTVSFLSGRSAKFNVGRQTEYISEISQAIVDDQILSSAETDTLETGLAMEIGGDRVGDSVYSRITIALNNLISFQTFVTGSGQLALPDVSNRMINTETRSSAGDIIMIAGIVQERDESSREGVPLISRVLPLVASRDSQSGEKSELVILLRPRIVLFEAGAGQ